MQRPEHILIVDDDAEIRTLLRDYLERNGARATAMTAAALDFLRGVKRMGRCSRWTSWRCWKACGRISKRPGTT